MIIDKRRWTTLVASVIINVSLGFVYSWSVFVTPLQDKLGASATSLTLAFSIICMVMSIFNILGGALHDRYGPRRIILIGGVLYGGGIMLSGFVNSVLVMYLTYGVMAGIGLGFCYCSVVANIANFFPDSRGMVTGIVLAAYGSGAIIFAPLSQGVIDAWGVMGTFKLLGAIIMCVILASSFFVKRCPPDFNLKINHTPDLSNTKIDKSWRQMVRDPLYYAILIMMVISTTSGLMIISQASPMAQNMIGVDPIKAAWLVGCISIANAGGRFFWGMISDFLGRAKSLTLIYTLAAITMVFLTFVHQGQFMLFTICALLIGFCYGGGMGIFPSITTDSFGTKNSGVNFGFVFIGSAVGSYIGPVLAAKVNSVFSSYVPAFMVATFLCVVGVSLSVFANWRIKHKNGID